MEPPRESFPSTADFHFRLNAEGAIQCSFGPAQVCLSVDLALEFHDRLAEFLDSLELEEYPDAPVMAEKSDESTPPEVAADAHLIEARTNVIDFAHFRASRPRLS